MTMEFNLNKSIEILERTPIVLSSMLGNLSEEWTRENEGKNTWSPFDVIGHLIHGEKTDWIPRMQIILGHGVDVPFQPFDRFAQYEANKNKSLNSLLEEFTRLRKENIRILKAANLDDGTLQKKGIHPEFGEVVLKDMLATWTVHDLGHIAQIVRVMAKQYKTAIGPWKAYLKIMD